MADEIIKSHKVKEMCFKESCHKVNKSQGAIRSRQKASEMYRETDDVIYSNLPH